MPDAGKLTHLRVPKTARVYSLGEFGASTCEVWITCHGYAQLAGRFIERFQSIVTDERAVIAPEGLHRFYLDPIDRSAEQRRVGATWMTREAREDDISDYIEYLDRVCEAMLSGQADARIVGFGFSQGTATITRWAAASARRLNRLILWGAGLPPDLDWSRAESRLRQVPVTLVVGRRDPFALPERIAEQETLLREHGVSFQTVYYDGDHRVDPAVLRDVSQL
jgi:predicted esterase